MDLKLKGRKALVLGASQGIGRAVAEALINEGVDVAIGARDLERLEKVAKEIGAKAAVACDLSKAGEGRRATEKAISQLGGLDILVANTGGPKKGSFAEVTESQWQEDFQSLWMSTVESLQVALPRMKDGNFGRVLLVTSVAAKEAMPGLITSNGLRAGLAGFARTVATEYAAFGITVNLLLPGYTNTDRLKALNLAPDRVRQMVPAGRLGEPEELASLAAFLASPRAAYITGQSIAVDGGVLRSH